MVAMTRVSDSPSSPVVAPGRLPLLGHVLRFFRDPFAALEEYRELGDVVIVYAGPNPIYLVNSPEYLREILENKSDEFPKGRVFDKLRPILGDGLVTAVGDEHRKQRALVAPTFKRPRLGEYAEVMQREIDRTVAGWKSGDSLELGHLMPEVASSMAFKALFGEEVDAGIGAEFSRCLRTAVGEVGWRLATPNFFERFPTPGNGKFKRANARMVEIAKDITDAHLRSPEGRQDLFSHLTSTIDPNTGQPLSYDRLLNEARSLMAAVSDTTGMALAWLFYELHRNPDVRKKLQAEIDDVLDGEAVGLDDLPNLPYMRKVIDETLRLHSISWVMTRSVARAVKIGGTEFPADATIIFSIWSVHRDPKIYSDPDRFDPDRWTGPAAGHTYLPFSYGPGRCLGDHFARLQMMIVLATICSRWNVELEPGAKVKVKTGFALALDRLPMVLHDRDGNDASVV